MSTINNSNFTCFSPKIFYCNGMTTTEKDAYKCCEEIQKLTNTDVELHYNDTTCFEDASSAVGKGILGVIGLLFASQIKKKDSDDVFSKLLMGGGGGGQCSYSLGDY